MFRKKSIPYQERAFRVKKKDNRILRHRKRKWRKRLERKQWPEQARPMFGAQNIQYEMAERTRAIDCGGIGAFDLLARKSGLIKALDESLHVLKRLWAKERAEASFLTLLKIVTAFTSEDKRNGECKANLREEAILCLLDAWQNGSSTLRNARRLG